MRAKKLPGTVISPTRVLYAYDGPAIFTAKVGIEEYLFYKADELEESDIFLAAEITPAKS